MSSSVDRPRKKAKPRTEPTARKYRRAAPISDTKSAARIVRNDREKPRSSDDRIVFPLRTSSFRRSKYTTYESTVIPTETMMPVTPDSVSVKPMTDPNHDV